MIVLIAIVLALVSVFSTTTLTELAAGAGRGAHRLHSDKRCTMSRPVSTSARFSPALRDDFTGRFDDEQWYRYVGRSTASGSSFDDVGVSVDGGCLTLTSRRHDDGTWTGAGLGSKVNLQYGRWTVRARMDRGVGTTFVALLWTTANRALPEIDFAEDNGNADRTMMSRTLHTTTGRQLHREVAVDVTNFHSYTVEWTPTSIVYKIDNRVWSRDVRHGVHTPMRLGLQTEPWVRPSDWQHNVTRSTPTTVKMIIDYVQIDALR